MLSLNREARELLGRFGDRGQIKDRADYKRIEEGYNRLISVFLYVNQEALPLLPRENLDDINSAVSRLYESLFWARRSLGSAEDSGYTSVDWLLISDRRDGMVFIWVYEQTAVATRYCF